MNIAIDTVLKAFGLAPAACRVEKLGSGLINDTFKVDGSVDSFVLQQINTAVFKSPNAIAENLNLVAAYLRKNYPDYLFTAPLPALSGKLLVETADGGYYRLLPFVTGSHTINAVQNSKQAFEAARQFGKFSRLLQGFDVGLLQYTLPDFHNLPLRFAQFKKACETADNARLNDSDNEINEANGHFEIVVTYQEIVEGGQIPLRVIHHDTKINNVLFDEDDNGLCVIDLDTIMPGYFLSDVGDMMRTYLSSASEEETDMQKISINQEFFASIYKGYMWEMGDVLTTKEKDYFFFAGKMMIYMQALRFLTDHLNNDIYYGIRYPGHNLMRAKNQFTLLNNYIEAEPRLRQVITI